MKTLICLLIAILTSGFTSGNDAKQDTAQTFSAEERKMPFRDFMVLHLGADEVAFWERYYEECAPLMNENDELKAENARLREAQTWWNMGVTVALTACAFIIMFYVNLREEKKEVMDQYEKMKAVFLKLRPLKYKEEGVRHKEEELRQKEQQLLADGIKLEAWREEIRMKHSEQEELAKALKEESASLKAEKEEIEILVAELKKRQQKVLRNTVTGKKLIMLSNKETADRQGSLIDDKDWLSLKFDIKRIYGDFVERLRGIALDLTPDEINFCCLSLLGIKRKGMAILLGINEASIYQKQLRIKERARVEKGVNTFDRFIFSI